MCERIMGNLDLFRNVRMLYKSNNGFDVHGTSRHSVPSLFPDQLKGAWFCLKERFFQNLKRKDVKCYSVNGDGKPDGKVPTNFLDIRQKGKDRIVADFTISIQFYRTFSQVKEKTFDNFQYRISSFKHPLL